MINRFQIAKDLPHDFGFCPSFFAEQTQYTINDDGLILTSIALDCERYSYPYQQEHHHDSRAAWNHRPSVKKRRVSSIRTVRFVIYLTFLPTLISRQFNPRVTGSIARVRYDSTPASTRYSSHWCSPDTFWEFDWYWSQ
jgi:hypothetical protein